jgi:O-glycosyl hydrolase
MKHSTLFYIFLFSLFGISKAETTLTIEPDNRQPVTQWGIITHNRPDWNRNWAIANFPQALDALYSELGTTLVRFDIGYATYDDISKRGALRDGILAATRRGAGWYGVPWSPPVKMKTLNHANGAVNGELNRLKPGGEKDVATWLVELIQWLEKEGVPLPVAISPQNEPDWGPGFYPGCVYSPKQMQKTIIELRRQLDAAGLTEVQVTGNDGATPDSPDPNFGTLNQLGLREGGAFYTNPEYSNALGIISTHSYDIHSQMYKTVPGSMNDFYEAVKKSGKEAWMTEWETRHEHTHNDWEIITETMRHFNRDMAGFGFNAWMHWKAWDPYSYTPPSLDPGQCVHPIYPGDGLVYKAIDTGKNPGSMTVRMSSQFDRKVSLSIHIDSADGPEIGKLLIPSERFRERDFSTMKIPLKPVEGIHDLYFKFSSPEPWPVVSLNWFRFDGGESIEAEAFSDKITKESWTCAIKPCYTPDNRSKWIHNNGDTIQRRPLFYIFKKIWNYAPADGQTFVRTIRSDSPAFQGESKTAYWQDLCAFVHGDTTTVVIVNRNNTDQTVRIEGLTGKAANLFRYTKADAETIDTDLPNIGKFAIADSALDSISLPAESLTIVITKP